MPDTINILIVDDHPVVRDGLMTIISSESGMNVIGTASDGIEAEHKVHELNPDVILMDLVMPHMDGAGAIARILQNKPESKILVLTGFGDDRKILLAVQAGARGYILKDSPPEELLDAIRRVYNNEAFMQSQVLTIFMRGIKNTSDISIHNQLLTDREMEILKLVAVGDTNNDISQKLCISERTVTKHVSNILDKLQLTNRTQIAFYASRAGLLGKDQ